MNIFQSLIAMQVIFILGIANLISGILVLLTCRCVAGSRLTGKLMNCPGYKRLFSFHCSIWWIFWISVIIHAIFAIGVFGNPFSR